MALARINYGNSVEPRGGHLSVLSRAKDWLLAVGHQMNTASIRRGLRVGVTCGWLSWLVATAATASESKRLSIDDIVSMRTPQAVQISPDGKHVAFVLDQAAQFKARSGSSIWMVPSAGGAARQYTRAPTRAYSPQWSHDSRSIAFLAVRSNKTLAQVYLMDVNGGEARPITDHPTAVRSFDWSPDGSKIVYLAGARESGADQTEKPTESGYDEIDVGPSEPIERSRRSEIWIADIEARQRKAVSIGRLHVLSAQWSPKGDNLLLTVADSPYPDDVQLRPRLVTVSPSGGEPDLYCATSGKIRRAKWSPDGRAIAFLGSLESGTDFYPGGLFVCRGKGSAPENVVEGSPYAAEAFRWMPEGRSLLVTAAEDAQRYLVSIDLETRTPTRLVNSPLQVQFRSDYSISRDGQRIACVLAKSTKPPDIWIMEPEGPTKQLTHINPDLEGRTYGEGERVRWTAKDGWKISGVLIKPVGFQSGERYPMITHLHGSNVGEANDFQVSTSHWGQFFAAHGYAVLMTNYRGSLMGSYDFRRGARGDFGGKDLGDILAGVEAMVERGIADPDRLGVSGISYGGYLTALAATTTTRFKAGVMASGISSWFSIHTGQTKAPESAVQLEWSRSPYDNQDLLLQRSPSTHVSKAKTPLLIMWGEKDPAIPVSHAVELFRGLRHYGVPSKLVVFPREGHLVRERNHLKQYYRRMIEWFDEHIGIPSK